MGDRDLREGYIKHLVEEVLGADRVVSVSSGLEDGADGRYVERVVVIYHEQLGISVDDMERVHKALWPAGDDVEAPYPVIDFQADSDLEQFAAE